MTKSQFINGKWKISPAGEYAIKRAFAIGLEKGYVRPEKYKEVQLKDYCGVGNVR